jgi:hypothetical protein
VVGEAPSPGGWGRRALAVRAEDVEDARTDWATGQEIHDGVLIAAMFCMCNRYVDGLATLTPDDPAGYAAKAEVFVRDGCLAGLPKPE